MFNILTRTNNRPKYFFLCHSSLKSQDYEGSVKHYVSIDDPKTMEYISMYRNELNIVNVERQQKTQANSFPYNDYLNSMLAKVEEGWVMVLDDDDKFMKEDVLSIISNKIKEHDEDTIILWKVKIGARICPSAAYFGKQIRRNDISNIGFAFHSKHKDKACWPNLRGGDFKCIDSLSKHLKCVWIDDILTCTNNNAGNFGNQRDIVLNNDDTNSYTAFCKQYSEVMDKMLIENYSEPSASAVSAASASNVASAASSVTPVTHVTPVTSVTTDAIAMDSERVYVLKESSIKAIAEMLSSAIQSKQLYEDIINQNYLSNNSITKHSEPKIQHHQKSSTNAKEILQRLEKDEELKASMLMQKSEVLSSMTMQTTNAHNIIVLTRGIVSKEKKISYLEDSGGIARNNISFISCDSIDFNSNGLINAAKFSLEKDYEKVIVIHEESLLIKNFAKEMQLLCSYPEYKDSDIIFCGLQESFGRSLSKHNTRVAGRSRTKKKTNTISSVVDFDPDYYCALYEDLRHNDINTHNKAREHWEKYGYEENRIGKRQLIAFDKSMSSKGFTGIILSRNACVNISECFDESLVSIMLLKEFAESSYVVSPYLFESEATLTVRKHNASLYKR